MLLNMKPFVNAKTFQDVQINSTLVESRNVFRFMDLYQIITHVGKAFSLFSESLAFFLSFEALKAAKRSFRLFAAASNDPTSSDMIHEGKFLG